MKHLDVFYQREGVEDIEHIVAEGDARLADIRVALVNKHGLDATILVFIEDEDEPVAESVLAGPCHGLGARPIHLHRCHRVGVAVTFNGETVRHEFSPGTTIARVKRWAAETQFGMSPEEAGEHVLQVSGTHNRPSPSTHIGALVRHGQCRIAFDLVPEERVNGSVEYQA